MIGKKILCVMILLVSACSRLPQREEVDFRNQLENAIVKTFPSKLTVYIHNFSNRTANDVDNTYLVQAIPDSIETLIDPIRDTLSYRKFDEMPFYVSSELSNLLQRLAPPLSNTNSTTSSTSNNYFSYLTNYLIITQELITQTEYDFTTNTNYLEVTTNTVFQNGVAVTNFVSNEILSLTTNSSNDVIIPQDRYILTPTNMLLLIHEEFPQLTNYLSYIPIDVVRAGEDDKQRLEDFLDPRGAARRKAAKEKAEADKKKAEEPGVKEDEALIKLIIDLSNRAATNEQGAAAELLKQRRLLGVQRRERQAKATNTNTTATATNKTIPDPPAFTYEYHIYGSFQTLRSSRIDPLNVNIQLYVSPVLSSGLSWWTNNLSNMKPPSLNGILEVIENMDTNDIQSFKDINFRLPYKRPIPSRRLADEIADVSTNQYLDRPELPEVSLPERVSPLLLRRTVVENQISELMKEWQKQIVADIVNRPYTVLQVETTPPGTLVYLDGVYIGKTPLIHPTAPLGFHRISFLQDGYSRSELFTTIEGGKTNKLSYNLISLQNSGAIEISSSMLGSEVYINALFRGVAPLTVSNLSLGEKYRIEVMNPSAIPESKNRKSAYKEILLTEDMPYAVFNASFKTYETFYKPRTQKMLLSATYLSWFTTIGLLGGTIYTFARYNEYRDLATISTDNLRIQYSERALTYQSLSQSLLYSSLAGILVSSAIMGWYIHSKNVYLGFIPSQDRWYAQVRIKF
ncbi:MAG: PEGA domain-containing protein [Brevinema sp.]